MEELWKILKLMNLKNDRSIKKQKTIVHDLQRDVLVQAINKYIQWRNNKDRPDGRGYATTFFSWFLHYGAFGENRANALKSDLVFGQKKNPILLLQNHFKNNSRLNNHSLDTYLLESMAANHYLFLLDHAPSLNTEYAREQMRSSILAKKVYSSSECAYQIGKLYEGNAKIENHLHTACQYFLVAIEAEHTEAFNALMKLATDGSQVAQYNLGVNYYHRQDDVASAINWCLLAAEQKHPKAIDYLFNTPFNATHYLMLARKYEIGKVVTKNIKSSLYFYEKSSALHNIEAALYLGKLYKPSLDLNNPISDLSEGPIVKKDIHKSFDYYSIAAMEKDETALEAIINITEHYNDDNFKFNLAALYLDVFSKPLIGLTYFVQLADKNIQKATNKLELLAQKNPNDAYTVGTLYEKDGLPLKACEYYSIAISNKHEKSLSALTALAGKGNATAQYNLGFYYHKNHQVEKAIDWCLLAVEQKHPKAIDYLFNTPFDPAHYLMLARKYEIGETVTKNTNSALYFYEKSSALNNKDAAIRLGQLYQPNFNDNGDFKDLIEKNNQISFNYYLIAANQKEKSALREMVKISTVSNDNKLKLCLGDIYLNVFEEPLLALNCFKNMADNNYEEAIVQLKMLTKKPEYANIVAKLYQDETRTECNLQMAAYYYAISIHYSDSDIYRQLVQSELNILLHSKEISEEELISMGDIFYAGKNGIPQNYSQAILWYEQACARDCARAHYSIGVMYEQAHGVEQNIITAIRYFQLAEDKGHEIAKNKLDVLLNANERTPMELTTIALMYQNGSYGIIKNYLQVVMLYQKASEKGDDLAALHLGHFHQLDHDSLPRDAHLAFNSYLRAATLLNQDALIPLERLGDEVSAENQLKLSQLYGTLFKNMDKSEYWCAKAKETEQFDFQM